MTHDFLCQFCSGKGWVHKRLGREDWPDSCPRCKGAGGFTLHELAQLLEEDPGTLKRTIELRNRRNTAWRIFNKVIDRCLSQDLNPKNSPPDILPSQGSGRQGSFSF